MSFFTQNMEPHIFRNGNESIPNGVVGCICSHHMNNKEGGSPLDLKVGHKCNESTQKLNDKGSPT